MTGEGWTALRFLLVYPTMATFGIAWCIGFVVRYKRTHCPGDKWVALSGASLGLWALTGIVALWLSKWTGFNGITSALFTLGSVIPMAVLVAGVLQMFVHTWRRKS